MLSSEQIRSLLSWVRENTEAQSAVYPFLASIEKAALLPGEATALRVDDLMLPDGRVGELLIRAGEGRKAPVGPRLADLLKEWISSAGLKPGDLLFPGKSGAPLSSSAYRRVWKQAREAVLSPNEVEVGLGKHVASLRDFRVATWLTADIPPWAVAEWVGMTANWVAVRYPHCFRTGRAEIDWDYLAEVLALPDVSTS
ncbi:tyrosine-type recombinase/integrase [Streptomyces sp. NPDC087844]|uniref:tyrosine-type recombinase/integrase n=1 Tax=Streptomyces sp. NPDC087844 TaxID=3365805 RepID=UPI0037F7FCC0